MLSMMQSKSTNLALWMNDSPLASRACVDDLVLFIIIDYVFFCLHDSEQVDEPHSVDDSPLASQACVYDLIYSIIIDYVFFFLDNAEQVDEPHSVDDSPLASRLLPRVSW